VICAAARIRRAGATAQIFPAFRPPRRADIVNESVRFLTGVGAAAGLAFINSIATIGGFAGPYLMGFMKDAYGTFQAGLLAMAAVLFVTTVLAASLKLFIRVE
jgi:hypothetical protein